jgi:hypothetical protein
MAIAVICDVLCALWLVATAMRKGFDSALGLAAALLLVFPSGSRIPLPGLFDLTTQRVIVVVLVGLYFGVGQKSSREQADGPIPMLYVLAALLLWMLLSSAQSVVPGISFKSTLSQYFDFCALYVIYARSIRSREGFEKVLAGFVAGMFVCSIFGLLEIYRDWKVTSLFPEVASRFADLESVDSRGVRVQSTFDHAILFGAALAMAIPMALHFVTSAKTAWKKAYLWCALLVMLLCIYKTSSRGPWIALLMSVVLLAVFGRGKLRSTIAVIGILMAVILVVRPGIRDSIMSLYGETMDPDSPQGESYQWRYVLFHISHEQLSQSLQRSLLGFGPESFYYLGLTADVSVDGDIHTVKVESCDSSVVELMMETGYVGFSLVALILLTGIYCTLRAYFRSSKENANLSLILLANLCAFSFLMSNVALFGWGQQSYMLWILLAMAMSLSKFVGAEGRNVSPVGLRMIGSALPVVSFRQE